MADLPGTVFPKYCSLLSELLCSSLLFSSLIFSFSLSCSVFILVYFSSFFSPYSFSHVSHFCFSSQSSPVPLLLRTPKGRTHPYLTSGHKRKTNLHKQHLRAEQPNYGAQRVTTWQFSEKDTR